MGKFTFRKDERLKSEKNIKELFSKGSSFYLFPFKVLVLPTPDPSVVRNQVLISVSKKNFKRAVDRNLIKRRIREAYRLQKEILSASPALLIGFIYTHKEILQGEEIAKKTLQALKKIPKLHTWNPTDQPITDYIELPISAGFQIHFLTQPTYVCFGESNGPCLF